MDSPRLPYDSNRRSGAALVRRRARCCAISRAPGEIGSAEAAAVPQR